MFCSTTLLANYVHFTLRNKSHTNVNSDMFRHLLLPFSGSSVYSNSLLTTLSGFVSSADCLLALINLQLYDRSLKSKVQNLKTLLQFFSYIKWCYMFQLLMVLLDWLKKLSDVTALWIRDLKIRSYNGRLISAYSHSALLTKSLSRCVEEKITLDWLPENGISGFRNTSDWKSVCDLLYRM